MTSTFPAPAEKWADIGDLRMRYLDWGGDGPPILALHGLASCAHWYDLVAPELAGKFRVIVPDQRGHGQTTQAPTGYDWQTLASDVLGLMDHVGAEHFTVLGHSWGGNVAINLAADHPDRVSSLVMIDGGFFGARLRGNTTWEEFQKRAAPRNVSGTRQDFLDRIKGQLSICWNDDVERIVLSMVWEDDEGEIHDILRPDNHARVMQAMWDSPGPASQARPSSWRRGRRLTAPEASSPCESRRWSSWPLRRSRTVGSTGFLRPYTTSVSTNP